MENQLNKTDYETQCPVCKKKFTTQTWTQDKGVLKGMTIIENVFCSKMCEKKFNKLIEKLAWED